MLARPNAGAVRPSASATEPLFSFGVIADVQYADIPDGRSFLGVPRYYRHSLAVLRRAVRSWNAHGGVRFCVNFGDIVDGFCPRDRSLAAVRAVVREFDGFRGGPAYHMLGNHCLYNLPRSELVSELRMPSPPGRAYYDFSPWPGYRFVVLDAYDFSAVGRARGDPVAAAARRFLEARNPNRDKNSPSGLEGAARRFVMFNGGVGSAQLRWLDGVLRGAAARREKAVVCSHLPVHPGAASPTGLMWNYEEVAAVVRRHGGCVVACLAGHDHKGGYAVDDRGVHHRTLEAALECPPGTDAFGRVEVYPDRLRLVGSDRMASTEMLLNSSSSDSVSSTG
jgi:manganese-dependent ADP-ribose/CDP-alcohol diphosphatase